MDVMKTLYEIGIVPVIAIEDAKKAVPLAKALVKGGLPCAEVTFRTEAGKEAIKNISSECPEILVGAGTVLNIETAKEAVEAGARFIVSPGLNVELVKWCIDKNIPCMPGCANPTEMTIAYNLGLRVVKVFPAENLGGINYLKACGAALPLKFMPTGGVNTKNLHDYAGFEKVFACGGTWMVKKDMIEAEKWDEIINICKEAVRTMLGFTIMHVGINCNNKDESLSLVKLLSSTLDIPIKEGNSSNFAGTIIEATNNKGRGTNGHIAIGTYNVDRAIYHMTRWGVKFDEDSRKVDEKTGNTKVIYLDSEFGGFAIHLVKR